MAIKVNGCTVIDDSKNVCATTVCACCVSAASTVTIPSGDTASRPTGSTGQIYFDTDTGGVIAHDGTDWKSVGGGGSAAPNAFNQTTDEAWGFVSPWNPESIHLGTSVSGYHCDFYGYAFSNPKANRSCCFFCSSNICGNAFFISSAAKHNNCILVCQNIIDFYHLDYCGRINFGSSGGRPLENMPCGCCTTGAYQEGFQVWCDGSITVRTMPTCSLTRPSTYICGFCDCAYNWPKHTHITSKGAYVLQQLPVKPQTPFCSCSGLGSFSKDSFYYEPYLSQSLYGPSPFIPFRTCNWNGINKEYFDCNNVQFITSWDSFRTPNEQVCCFAFQYPYCAHHRPRTNFVAKTAVNQCLCLKICMTPMISCCDCVANFNMSDLMLMSSRNDIWGGGLPGFKDSYVDQVVCCNPTIGALCDGTTGISLKAINPACCPFIILRRCSYACLNNNATYACVYPKNASNLFYSKDGEKIYYLANTYFCSTLSTCIFSTTPSCCILFPSNQALTLNVVCRVNACISCNYIFTEWDSINFAHCCAGCTYGTDPVIHPSFYNDIGGLLGSTFDCRYTSNQTRTYHDCLAGNYDNGLPWGSGVWSYNSNRYYLPAKQNQAPTCGCIGSYVVFNGDTETIECAVNYRNLIGQSNCAMSKSERLMLFASKPCMFPAKYFKCGPEICKMLGTDDLTDWATYVQGITGSATKSLFEHCLGYVPMKNTLTANCAVNAPVIGHIGPRSNFTNQHTWVNPVNDHLVMIRAIGDGSDCCGGTLCGVGWMGIICYDITNCCVSEVNTIYPSRPCDMNKWYDYRFNVCGCEPMYDNPNIQFFGACATCTSVESCASIVVAPYGDYSMYMASGCTETGGVVMNLSGNVWSIATKIALCCFNCYSKYFGCLCTVDTSEFGSNTTGNIIQWLYYGQGMYRVPHSKPMSCVGFRCDPFLVEVFNYVVNGQSFNLTSPSAACKCCLAKCEYKINGCTWMPGLCACSTATKDPFDAVGPYLPRILEIVEPTKTVCYIGFIGTGTACLQNVISCFADTDCISGTNLCYVPGMIDGIKGSHLGNSDDNDMSIERYKMVSANYQYPSDPRGEVALDNKSAWGLCPGEDFHGRFSRWWDCIRGCSS